MHTNLAFFREFIRQWHGETILVSDSLGRFNATEYFLAVNHVPYTHLPIGRMLERLATGQETGRVIVALGQRRPASRPLASRSDCLASTGHPGRPQNGLWRVHHRRCSKGAQAQLCVQRYHARAHGAPRASQPGRSTRLDRYEPKATQFAPGDRFVVNLYWKAIGRMPESYTGFLHLIGPDGHFVTQDDHELGRGFYRTYLLAAGRGRSAKGTRLVLPKDIPRGRLYALGRRVRLPLTQTLGRALGQHAHSRR